MMKKKQDLIEAELVTLQQAQKYSNKDYFRNHCFRTMIKSPQIKLKLLSSTLALYTGYATLAALLPRCGKGIFGLRLIFAPKAQKSSAVLKVP
jgi:hypothetical protein